MTTKEQERKALDRIKKIVADLGPDSYVAAAFEGCFEIAADNIENDFACSMEQRAKVLADKLSAEIKEKQALRDRLERTEQIVSSQQAEIRDLRKCLLDTDDLLDCRHLADNASEDAAERTRKAAEKIVKLADDPTTDEFAEAVKEHRHEHQRANFYLNLSNRIQNRITAGA